MEGKGGIAVVTGASSGTGRATAKRLVGIHRHRRRNSFRLAEDHILCRFLERGFPAQALQFQ
jgi:NAD(P)-dependent dehydrogenase (short-subunit alcohol dehydrogenase family)